ncbi:60S acidic ribosomal protein P2 [Thalictrum thalictroides]|uniref:60S acidic ribosomal protein P2 n=1 Tax=Thalictrum thalictroides TaxID=46969 RepID=A0A7J6XG79_THATH|nr:60S acidic ribosomal protein P2 [Thalictrum thalictroides]
MLARLGGNDEPTAVDIKRIFASVGAEADDDRIELLLCQVKGKDLAELVASGREKLASVPSGGGGGGAPIVVAASGGGSSAPAAAEAKKEEKVEEKEESDDDMGFSLFD